MRKLIFIFIFIIACQNKNIKYSGFNDLVFGVQQIILYDNKRFYLELNLGGTEGNYKISSDTIILIYDNKPSKNWPNKILMTKDYFISAELDSLAKNYIKIKRNK